MPKVSALQRFLPTLAAAVVIFFFPILAGVVGGVPAVWAQGSGASSSTPPSSVGSNPANVQPSSAQKTDSAQKSDDDKPAETLKLNVNVVGLFFNVKDKHGALMPNL